MLARLLLQWLSLMAAPTVELTWSAGPECPSAQAAELAIVERLEARGFEGEVRVDAVLRESELGWVASVTVEQAVRSIEMQSCADAARSVAIVVAIATVVESAPPPSIAQGPVEPSMIPIPDEASPAEPPRESVREDPSPVEVQVLSEQPAPRRKRSDRVGLALGAEGLVAYGALPGVAGALAADVGLLWRNAFVQAGGLHRFKREHGVSTDPALGGEFRLTAGRLAAGPRYQLRRLELAAAGGAELGAIWARGVGVSTPLPRRRLWAAVSLGGRVGVRVAQWLAIAGTVEGVVPVLRPSFSLGGRVQVTDVGPASVRGGVRIEFRPNLRQKNLRTSDTGGQ